jgi:hypothetical protein
MHSSATAIKPHRGAGRRWLLRAISPLALSTQSVLRNYTCKMDDLRRVRRLVSHAAAHAWVPKVPKCARRVARVPEAPMPPPPHIWRRCPISGKWACPFTSVILMTIVKVIHHRFCGGGPPAPAQGPLQTSACRRCRHRMALGSWALHAAHVLPQETPACSTHRSSRL